MRVFKNTFEKRASTRRHCRRLGARNTNLGEEGLQTGFSIAGEAEPVLE